MHYVLKKLSEPSTYAGLAGLALTIGVSAPLYSAISMALAGVFATLSILVNEGQSS